MSLKTDFTEVETAPLKDLDEWEDDILQRYPEPGTIAKDKTTEEFRNYESTVKDGVREFYKLNHTYQTYDFVMQKRAEYLKFDKKEMPIWDAYTFLNQLVDDSDPDTDLDQLQHLLQTSEAIRADGHPDWMVLTGKQLFTATLGLLILASCSQNQAKDSRTDGEEALNADTMKRDITILSADSFLGRKPFTAGETITVDYLTREFKAIGLEAGNGSSYTQDVPMVNLLAKAAPEMQVESPKGKFTLKAFDDYIMWTDKSDSVVTVDKAELIFAGYGVVAPEYNWNDYAGLDVKGKVVLVMVNDPGFWAGDTTLFKGKTMTYYGRWTYKFEEAARQGAKGCLIVHNTAAASYPFSVQQNSFNNARLQLDNRGKDIPNCDFIGWVPEKIANRLFVAAGFDSTLLVNANKQGFKPVPLNLTVSTTMQVGAVYNKSQNVIGKITGTKHPEEVIIYTAHWDHLGVGRPDAKGDSIYNGALDNASGTAGLLQLARAFAAMKTKPERTIIFLAVTAEEQGLLGSAYYAQNPIYPAAKTVANINIDGLNPFTPTKDIVVVGQGQSDLEDYLKEVVEKAGGYISYESHPEAGYYYRSDHFNFAKAGIPALYVETGIDVVGKGKEYGEKLQNEYTEKNYHQPSDEMISSTWTMEGAIKDIKLLFAVGKRLAFEEKMPEWKTGSEFRAIREGKK